MFSQFGSSNRKVCILLPSYGTKVARRVGRYRSEHRVLLGSTGHPQAEREPLREVQTGLRSLAHAFHDWNVNNQA